MTLQQSLFAASALLTAALGVVVFPEMKNLLLLVPFALVILTALSGCGSYHKALSQLPDGHFATVRATETGKFASTSIEGEGLDKHDGKITAEKIHGQHTNPWVTNLEFTATGAEIDLGAPNKAAAKKPPAPIKPLPTPEIPIPEIRTK